MQAQINDFFEFVIERKENDEMERVQGEAIILLQGIPIMGKNVFE